EHSVLKAFQDSGPSTVCERSGSGMTSTGTGLLKGRTSAATLVVSRAGPTSNQLRGALKAIGFMKLTACSSHVAGLDRIKGRNFPLVIFDAASTDMPTCDFITQALALDQTSILIAVSSEPRIDDIFSLLRAGARGFVVSPFTV